jgi:hypothetical protein
LALTTAAAGAAAGSAKQDNMDDMELGFSLGVKDLQGVSSTLVSFKNMDAFRR